MTGIPSATEHTEIRRDWQFSVDADMVLQRQGANARKVRLRQPRLVALAEQAIAEGQSLIQPAVAYRMLKIQEVQPALVLLANGMKLKGHGIARKLAGAELAIATVATVGAEIETQILRATKQDPPFALALDGYATAAVGALIVAFRQYFAELLAARQLTTTTPLYPGTNDWELAAAQTELFSLVDAVPIGVSLTTSFLMTPCKSVSMVIGAGKKMPATMLEPCEECGASSTCRHRLTNP
jgi:hypothetical protein